MTSVRILDIAAEAGVSRSLVSKVLSGRMGTSTVRPELASRIRSIAQARGFVPNAAARSTPSSANRTAAPRSSSTRSSARASGCRGV